MAECLPSRSIMGSLLGGHSSAASIKVMHQALTLGNGGQYPGGALCGSGGKWDTRQAQTLLGRKARAGPNPAFRTQCRVVQSGRTLGPDPSNVGSAPAPAAA